MMRTIKLIVLGLLAAVLIALGVANMAVVDLYLLPAKLFGESYSIKGIPLAAVIMAAVLMGILAGLLIEYLREHKHRQGAGQNRREIARLRNQIIQLKSKLDDDEDDLPRIPLS
jgi:lipopolysaccharide assembly protein A